MALDIQNVTKMGPHAASEVDATIIGTRYTVAFASTFSITLIALLRILAILCGLNICVFWKMLF
jgi:hypothetical protein